MRIFGYDIDIELAHLDDKHGDYAAHSRQIRIHKEDDPEEQEATLFHEALHAALAISGVKYALGEDADHIEEAVVRAIEAGLWPLLQWRRDHFAEEPEDGHD